MAKHKIAGCTVRGETIERIRIVGPAAEKHAVFEYLDDEGFRATNSGPYTDAKLKPRVDVTRFLIIAERKLR